ncbi:hypothetical protein CCP2SC5_400002 [Azospirillaceae bacterium]
MTRNLSDAQLSYLLIQSAREGKKRLAQPQDSEDGTERTIVNPTLLRAIRQILNDLAESDACLE